jgi:hypothetical protein
VGSALLNKSIYANQKCKNIQNYIKNHTILKMESNQSLDKEVQLKTFSS